MAALSTKAEQIENYQRKMKKILPEDVSKKSDNFKFSVLDCVIIILSMVAIVVDLCTDLILISEYIQLGYKSWALGTFVLIFFPSLIVQTFSLRWHIMNKTAEVLHWVLHICMLGIIHRYVKVVEAGMEARKSKETSQFQKLYSDQSDLCILHLFESFLESAPQLVLQLYIIVVLHEWKFWTGLSAAASLVSLSWALAAYTRAQRRARPDKKTATWPGLVLQASWRIGMLTARISSLVLFAYCFGSWIFLLLGVHWLAMTIWIVNQKTDFCDTEWEERIYNAVAGVIYCFCFFNLQEGQSRWRALTFYLIIILQNLTCLTVFLMWFAGKTPKLAISAFVAIVGGTVIGVASMLLYYRFFHPVGPIKLCPTTEESQSHDTSGSHNSGTLRSLKHMRQAVDSQSMSQESSPQSDTKQLLNSCRSPLSDSVVIIEERVLDDSEIDIKVLQNWIGDESAKSNAAEVIVGIENVPTVESEIDGDAYKRRAICSSVDLVKLIESKEGKEAETETDSNGSLKLVGTEEAPSEILSAHDYENLCAVNIARETWGLRSWRGYSDIETWLHDDSVVHDSRHDTMTSTTTSSEQSGNTLQKDERTRQDDYMDTLVDDLAQCESEATSDGYLAQFSMESLGGMFPIGTLDTILEELEESGTCGDLSEHQTPRHKSASSLVATIDEIRLNTPIQNRYGSFEGVWDDFAASVEILNSRKPHLAPEEILFLSKLQPIPETNVVPIVEVGEARQDASTSPGKNEKPAKISSPDKVEIIKRNKGRPRRKFSLIRERFETKRSESTTELFTSNERLDATPFETVPKSKTAITDKENIPTVASKISHWDKILKSQNIKKTPEKIKPTTPTKRVSVKEKRSVFLKQVLTPPKFQTLKDKSLKTKPSS